jgi:hypothetical protein
VGKRFKARRSLRPAVWLTLLCSCASQQREPAGETVDGSEAPATGKVQPTLPPPATSDVQHRATVRIVNVAPGRFTLEADARVEVATAASLEHQTADGGWRPAPYQLRDGCPPVAAASCRAILPGAPFTPASWNGTPCSPCCPDQEPTPIEPGTYHLRLTACNDSAAHWSGPSFEMPAATDAVERWRATSNVQKVSAFRLGGTRQEGADADDEWHIAGRPIIPGTEVVLSDAGTRALIDWLRDANGFSDAVMRRCFPGKRFGFRLQRDVPQVGLEASEVAVDLGCQSIDVANQEGNMRARSFTYFDNSREALLAVVRDAMPGAVKGGRKR